MKEIHISEIENLEDKKSFVEGLFQGKDFHVCFYYQSDFQKTQLLRDIIDMVADIAWLDNKWKRRLVLIVDELNNNAIEYGSTTGYINKMTFVLDCQSAISMTIEVEDGGNGNKPKKAEQMRALQSEKKEQWFDNHDSIRGRGLFMIIENLVDDLYFQDAPSGWLIVGVKKVFD